MKGLMIKDLLLLKNQKRTLVILIVMALFFSFTSNNTTFIIGYLGFVISLMSISTISYDEFDNGNSFLFTLPITRKSYVTEKYCFSILLSIASLIVSSIIVLCIGIFSNSLGYALESLIAAPVMFFIILVILSVMLPLHLKYGAEKSRIALIIVFGIIFAIGFGLSKLFEALSINVSELIDNMLTLNPFPTISLIIAIVLAVLFISYRISISIMKKKEF